jgi:hypothetical protein
VQNDFCNRIRGKADPLCSEQALPSVTLSRHSEAHGFTPRLKTTEIPSRRLGQEICFARMLNQLLVFGIGFFGSAVVS